LIATSSSITMTETRVQLTLHDSYVLFHGGRGGGDCVANADVLAHRNIEKNLRGPGALANDNYESYLLQQGEWGPESKDLDCMKGWFP
jgi:hypothetical protein